MQEVGTIVWIDGTKPALVVGNGTDKESLNDGRVFLVELGSVKVVEPDGDGGYNFGSTPYDKNAKGDSANPGGFGPDSPAKSKPSSTSGDKSSTSSRSSTRSSRKSSATSRGSSKSGTSGATA